MPANNNYTNVFKRYAYSSVSDVESQLNNPDIYTQSTTVKSVFTGGDLQAFINNVPVTNLEQVTWSISVETVGNYVMGKRDAVVYTTGKRVIVGTLVFSQYDRHALLEEVFRIRAGTVRSDLWANDGSDIAANILINRNSTFNTTTSQPVNTANGFVQASNGNLSNKVSKRAFGLSGVSQAQYNEMINRQAQDVSRIRGGEKINYSDQLPPFNITLTGVNRSGIAARCAIYGVQITQETAGFSSSDISNATGLSFTALSVDPWRPIDANNGGIILSPVG